MLASGDVWWFVVAVATFIGVLGAILYRVTQLENERARARERRDSDHRQASRAMVEIAESLRLLLRERGIEPPKRPDDPSKPSS
jgi:hypothetical protein